MSHSSSRVKSKRKHPGQTVLPLSSMRERQEASSRSHPGCRAISLALGGFPEKELGPTLHFVPRKALGAVAASLCGPLTRANLDDNEGLY
jgi:hypothetical protein